MKTKSYDKCSKKELIDIIIDLKLNLGKKTSLVSYYTRMLSKANEKFEKQKEEISRLKTDILKYKLKGKTYVAKEDER